MITAWLREITQDTTDNLKHRPEVRNQAEILRRLWDSRFPKYPFVKFRKFLRSIAQQHLIIPTTQDLNSCTTEWIAPIDDDDWFLPELEGALWDIPKHFVMVCWSVRVHRFITGIRFFVEPIDYRMGPRSCGYALRRSWFQTLTPAQQYLICYDHVNAHRYVHFAGGQYLFLPSAKYYACYNYTPASISALTADNQLPFDTAENYQLIAEITADPAIRKIAKALGDLLLYGEVSE